MPQPRGRKTAMVNARLTAAEMEWLERTADERDVTLSAALRYAVHLARVFEAARDDYRARRGARTDPVTGEAPPWRSLLAFDFEPPEESGR